MNFTKFYITRISDKYYTIAFFKIKLITIIILKSQSFILIKVNERRTTSCVFLNKCAESNNCKWLISSKTINEEICQILLFEAKMFLSKLKRPAFYLELEYSYWFVKHFTQFIIKETEWQVKAEKVCLFSQPSVVFSLTLQCLATSA